MSASYVLYLNSGNQAADLALFAVLTLRGRAAEVCTEIWHERGLLRIMDILHVLFCFLTASWQLVALLEAFRITTLPRCRF